MDLIARLKARIKELEDGTSSGSLDALNDRITILNEALAVATFILLDMEIDVDNPKNMMLKVQEAFEVLTFENKALKEQIAKLEEELKNEQEKSREVSTDNESSNSKVFEKRPDQSAGFGSVPGSSE